MYWFWKKLSGISETNSIILACSDSKEVKTHLFGDTSFSQFDNNKVLNETITFCSFIEKIWYSD